MNGLKPRGRKAWDLFLSCLSSLRAGISFDFAGNPGWNLEMGDIKTLSITLDEIFYYLEKADKPCLVAIDEFQAIAKYPEKNIEAVLRTHIQHCANARFIYAGSQRHMMGEIFTSPARPFYQSTAIMELHPIDIGTYTKFIRKHFLIANKDITEETVQNVYERFEGITWYIQFISNSLYAMTATGEICTADKVSIAIENI